MRTPIEWARTAFRRPDTRLYRTVQAFAWAVAPNARLIYLSETAVL